MKLFFLSHEGFHYEQVVFEVEKFHAKMKRDLFLQNVNKLLPKAEVEDSGVCLHAE